MNYRIILLNIYQKYRSMKKWNSKKYILWGIIIFLSSLISLTFADSANVEDAFTNSSSKIEHAKIEHMNHFINTKETIFYIIK